MKKIWGVVLTTLLLCSLLAVSFAAASSQNGANISAFHEAEYAVYNTYAYKNGLAGDLLCIEGTIELYNNMAGTEYIILSQDDGNKWIITVGQIVGNSGISGKKYENSAGKRARAYCKYAGFSDLLKLPVCDVMTYGGVLFIEENEFVYSSQSDTLMNVDGISVDDFKRNDTGDEFPLEFVAAQSVDEFLGTWTTSKVRINGVTYTPEAVEKETGKPINIEFSVSDLARLKRTEEKQTWTWGFIYNLANGVLNISDGESTLTVKKTSAGELYLSVDLNELELSYGVAELFFIRAEEESNKDTANSDEINGDNATWVCPDCGNEANGNFCNNCGARRPSNADAKVQTTVDITATTTAKPIKPETTNTPKSATGVRKEVKDAIDSYEEFFKEYTEFMKKYANSSSPMSMLTDYMEMLTKYVENMEKWEKLDESYSMNDAELKYYFDASLRIEKMLLEVAY